MAKKKNKNIDKNIENEKKNAHADISDLIGAAKTSLFQLNNSYDFIEDEEDKKADEVIRNESSDIANAGALGTSDTILASEAIQASEAIEAIEAIEEIDLILADTGDHSTAENDALNESSNETLGGSDALENEAVALKSEIDWDETDEALAAFAEIKPELNESLWPESSDSLITEAQTGPSMAGTELENFEAVQIEELEQIPEEQLQSIIESVLFATDRPVSVATIKQIFLGSNVSGARIRAALDALKNSYVAASSGVSLEDVGSGFQLRTKLDNMEFIRRSLKARPFKLSGAALEVLSIVAYKQPMIKSEIDQIRGVESGHLLRALMEKNLCTFAGKSDLPGKPMLYETTRKFLEIFSLRNLKELPTLSQIDELIPEGIGDESDEKPKLMDITGELTQQVGTTYSEGEEELNKITGQLEEIQTSSDFFEQEKLRQRAQRDTEKAQNLREALAVGEVVNPRDLNWLKKYELPKVEQATSPSQTVAVPLAEEEPLFEEESNDDLAQELEAFDEDPSGEDFILDPEVAEANDLADIDGEDSDLLT